MHESIKSVLIWLTQLYCFVCSLINPTIVISTCNILTLQSLFYVLANICSQYYMGVVGYLPLHHTSLTYNHNNTLLSTRQQFNQNYNLNKILLTHRQTFFSAFLRKWAHYEYFLRENCFYTIWSHFSLICFFPAMFLF